MVRKEIVIVYNRVQIVYNILKVSGDERQGPNTGAPPAISDIPTLFARGER
jgi:hypothetical protein